jgi:topoisomerase-4 subunit A
VRTLKGHEIDPASLSFKAGDGLYGTFSCRSIDTLLVFGSNGRVYSVAAAALPGGRGDGQPVTSLIDLEAGSTPAHYFAGHGEHKLLLAGTGGFGLMAHANDLVSRQRGGKTFLALNEGEHPLPPGIVPEGATQLACVSLSGRLLIFPLDEVKLQPKGGRGLTLIDVDDKDALVSVAAFNDALLVHGNTKAGKPKEVLLKGAALAEHIGKRARKGKMVGAMKAQRAVAAQP